VPFVVNDAVRVSSGAHEGKAGAVISIESTSPTMRLLVELGDGAEIVVDASTLALVTS
jgi:ribosomal protein L24